MIHPILFYADRLPPLVGGVETHARYFIERFERHERFPLGGVTTKDPDGSDRLLRHVDLVPAIVFFNSGRWIEDLTTIRAAHPAAVFVYRTGGNEILKAPLERAAIPHHATRQAFWADTLNATIDLLITNSAFTEERLRAIGVHCPPARCVGGVNMAALTKPPRAPGPPRLFCAARFVPYKRHGLLLHVIHAIVARGYDLRLRLAGDGPLLPSIRAEAERLGVGRHVTFLGVLDNEAACREIAAADLYVQLSGDVLTDVPGGRYLHSEGMGRSILEALSAGTFVVAGRSGALHEVVSPDRGILVEPEDPKGIADVIVPLLRSPPRPDPTDRYAWERVFARYEGLWEGLLAAARRH